MSGNLTKAEVDALLKQTALPKRQGNMVSYNPTGFQQQAVANAQQQKLASGSLGDQSLAAYKANKQAAKPSGGGGILGTVLNNPVGKAVTGALGTLDIPRRVVISAIHEASDAIGSGNASFADFHNQVADPSYGVGKYVHTGNKWADRGLGFLGDVAADPLTYVTFGAGKFAGVGGRTVAAEKLAKAAAEAARLGDVAKAAELTDSATKIGRLGVMGANAAERDVLFAGMKDAEKLAQPGLRFAGHVIPGTEHIAEGVGGALSKTRAAIGDTKLGQAGRSLRATKGLEAAAKQLATGSDTVNGLEVIAQARQVEGSTERFATKYANRGAKIAKEAHKAGEQADRAALRQLDEGLTHGPLAKMGQGYFGDIHSDASQTVKAMGHREHFAPHDYLDDARQAMRGDAWTGVRQQLGIETTEATGGAVKRTIHPGSKLTLPDGKVVVFDDAADMARGSVSIRQINEKLAGPLGVKKVVEDHLSRVIKPYVTGIADSVGRAKATAERGLLSGRGGFDEVVDTVATKKAANAEVKDIGKQIKSETKINTKLQKTLAAQGDSVKAVALGDLQKQLTDATGQLTAARAAEKQATNVAPAIEAQRKLVTKEAEQRVSAAQSQIDQIATEQSNLVTSGQAHDVAAQAAIDERRSAQIAAMGDAEKHAQTQYDQLDAAKAAAVQARFDSKSAQVELATKVADTKAKLAQAKRINTNPSKGTAEAFNKVQRDLEAVVRVAGDSPEMHQTASLLSDYAKGVADLRDGQTMNRALREMEKAVKSGDIKPVFKKVIQDGYEQIGVSLLGEEAPIVKKELARQLENLNNAFEDDGIWKVLDKYTQYFKTYATATLGFHARNGLTAGFMNATDGVTVRNMRRGSGLWEEFARRPETFLDNLPEWITPQQADDALQAVFASGGGGGQFGKAELRIGASKLTNNKYTRLSQRLGSRVEGYARMGMSIDTILAGGSWEEAAARIARVHFDYSQVSKFDAKMKRLIPFWTFVSRNVPMQVQQMFLKPRMYQRYSALARNMGQDYENGMVPLSWQEAGAFQLGKGTYLAPDLSHLQLKSDLAKLTSDPQRLLADANPLFKVPFETLIAKRQLFNDRPFQAGAVESVSHGGLSVLAPLLEGLGLTSTAGDGSTVIDAKLAYALRGLNPLLSQNQRLTGDDPYYKDKRVQSILNWSGVPLKTLTPGQKAAEQGRRTRAANAKDPKMAALKAFQG